MVVDYKDINRCNNRVENFYWVIKFENVLNNLIICRRVINICGSVEVFFKNFVLIWNSFVDFNFIWMCIVIEEEVVKCKVNLE